VLLTTDRALLDGYRRGDRAALERIFEHYAPAVARWVQGGFTFRSQEGERRFDGFRSAVDAHDAIHEVFRAVFEGSARSSYSGLTPFEGYLFVTTRNVVLKRLRVRDRDRPIESAVMEEVPSNEPSPEERVQREEEVQMVRAFLATLDDEERSFVELRFVEQLPQNTVGDRLGWSRKKVRIKEAAVRQALIRFLKRRRGSRELGEEAQA
jgi:RNA polymerase sigma factor (sigma-70 family)